MTHVTDVGDLSSDFALKRSRWRETLAADLSSCEFLESQRLETFAAEEMYTSPEEEPPEEMYTFLSF